MATVARLHPRHWDGRRLLQFLTGLALVALAFAVPALTAPPDVPEPAPVVTVVDAPAPGTGLTGRVVQRPRAAAVDDTAGAAATAFPGAGAESAATGDDAEPCAVDAVLDSWTGQSAAAGRAPPVA